MIPLRAWTEIDLSAYERNLKNIKQALPETVSFISVVKADAYGHGLPQIVERSLIQRSWVGTNRTGQAFR